MGNGTAWQASGNARKAARAPLRSWLRQASLLLVTANEEYTPYGIGGDDVLLSPNRFDELVRETGRGGALPTDWHTGRRGDGVPGAADEARKRLAVAHGGG